MKELNAKGAGDFLFMKTTAFTDEELEKKEVLEDSAAIRKQLVVYVDDAKQFGVEVEREVKKDDLKRIKRTASEKERDPTPLSASERYAATRRPPGALSSR